MVGEDTRHYYLDERVAGDYAHSRWFASHAGRVWYRATREIVELALAGGAPLEVLDVGCGSGTWTVVAAEMGHHVTGLDLSLSMLHVARSLVRDRFPLTRKCAFLVADVGEVPLKGKFDVVLCIRMLDHVAQKERVISGFRELLKVGGRVCIVTKSFPSIWTGRYRLNRLLSKVFRSRYPAPRRAGDVPVQLSLSRMGSVHLTWMLRKHGFDVKRVHAINPRLPIVAEGDTEFPVLRGETGVRYLDWSQEMGHRLMGVGTLLLGHILACCSESYAVVAERRC